MPLNYGLIHHVDLVLQELPSSLQGVKIAHLTDLHITRHTHRHDRLMNQLTSLRIDMALFTGDYMRREDDHVEAGRGPSADRRCCQSPIRQFRCIRQP